MEYSFSVEDAQEYGLNEAIFLKNVKFWILKNIANNENKFEVDSELYPELKGEFRTWTYNSVKSYQKLFPFWSPKQTRVAIDSLLKQGILLKGCYNTNQYDRTCWYALRVESICLVGQMEMPKKANGDAQKGKSITDSKPDEKPDDNTICEDFVFAVPTPTQEKVIPKTPKVSTPQKYSDDYEAFWKLYDKADAGGKKQCFDKWVKLSIEEKSLIMQHVKDYKQKQPDPQYRKNPITYFNQKPWVDFVPKPEFKQAQRNERADTRILFGEPA